MATSLTRNLKLRVNSNLTADAKYNLQRLDLLGSTFLVDTTDTLGIRSSSAITIEPESADIGGSGTGGTVSIGSSSHSIQTLAVYADSFELSAPLLLKDQASSGDKFLSLVYKSDLEGSVDTVANRSLLIDLGGADRNLILGGSLSLLGGWSLALNLTEDSSVTLPSSGTLSTLAGVEVLTNKTIDASLNTITNIDASSISPAFGNQQISTENSLRFIEAYNTDIRGAQSGQSSNIVLTLPPNTGSPNQTLTTDGSGTLSWTTSAGSGTVVGYATDWVTGDGLSKTVTHSLGSTDVQVQVVDLDDNTILLINEIEVTDTNTLTLTASESPASSWRVVVQA